MFELNAFDFQIIDTLIYGCIALFSVAMLLFAGAYLRGKIQERKWKRSQQ